MWIELNEGFQRDKTVTQYGEYNINGMKVGRWNIMNQRDKIGGGTYDNLGNQRKIGMWVELDEWFNNEYQTQKRVTYNGEYNLNGVKIGRWDIMYCNINEEEYKLIGGGSYDQEGYQKKIGIDKKVTYYGEYNKDGIKLGRWDILYCKNGENEYKQMNLVEMAHTTKKKIGQWIELDEDFSYYKQVTYNGVFNKDGMKVGRWNIMYCKCGESEYKQMQKLKHK